MSSPRRYFTEKILHFWKETSQAGCDHYLRAANSNPSSARLNAKLYVEGDDLYADMLSSIAQAKESICLESYIFASDEVGWRFANALTERAEAGIKVRVHIDAAGAFLMSSHAIEKFLRQGGVRLRWFHRWSWQQPWRYNQRNHRKLLVVDKQECYLGGFNIHRENSRQHYGEQRWRDTHVRIHGRQAREIAAIFDRFWHGQRTWEPLPPTEGSMLVPSRTRHCLFLIRTLIVRRINQAQRQVLVTTPYFVPDQKTQQALIRAAKRGVDVRLLVPHKSDVRITEWAAHAAYSSLLAAGVKVYEYLPRMLHAKTVVIDEAWCSLGTANLDYRSLFINQELNLISQDVVFCQQLAGHFHEDIKKSQQIQSHHWENRHWLNRITEVIGWVARRWL